MSHITSEFSSEFPGIRSCPDGVEIDLKVVPGARSDRIMGILGTRVKIRVSAPPEAGKANKAVTTLLARTFTLPVSKVTMRSGATSAEKTVHLRGLTPEFVRTRLG